MTGAERKAAWKARNNPSRPLSPCGTRAAYVRHIRNGEVPCQDCVEANRRKNAENYVQIIKPKRQRSSATEA